MKNNKDNISNYLYHAVSEIEDYAIILMDTGGFILNWNKGAEKIKGYTEVEIIGTNFRKFYTPEDLQLNKPEKLLQEAIEKGRAQDEGWRIKKNGGRFWASVTISAVHNGERLVGFSKITRDLTERKINDAQKEKHAQELIAKNKELEQFVYIASHDLQEPLRTISSLTEMLLSDYKENFDPRAQQMADYVIEASNRMKELISGLLDYSRIGRLKELVEVDFNEIIKAVKHDLSVVIKENEGTIIAEKLPVLKGYKTELRLLFQNLISNAIKFRKHDVQPVIHILYQQTENGLHRFAVTDNGIGINPAYKDKIFIIFQRLNSREAYKGNGIGLSHCRKIVELHNGTIWVESTPGKGCTFYFTINNLDEHES